MDSGRRDVAHNAHVFLVRRPLEGLQSVIEQSQWVKGDQSEASRKSRFQRESRASIVAWLGIYFTSCIGLEHCHYHNHIMILRSNYLCASSANVSILLPDFLVPALCVPHRSRPFTSTSRSQSRIGGAPFTTPQGVDLRFLDAPAKRKQDVTTTELPKTLEIIGPLGT